MGALTDKAKNIRMNTCAAMDAVSHTASFDEKLRDLRTELTKIVKNKNKLKADEKELYEFVMSNKQYVSFVKENIRTILTKGDEKKGFKHILIRHYGTGADSEISVWDIIRIGKTIIDGSYLTSAEIGRYKDRIGKSRQAKRRLSKTPDGDFIYIVGIGREINGDNIVITYFKNKLGGRATDVKPQSADVAQDTIGNGDRHVPNTAIIPKNTNQVNMDNTTQLTDRYKAILKKQAWHKRLMEWHKDSHPLTKNADGTPKVFYHGTGADFEAFRSDIGIFLSTNPKTSETYAMQNNMGEYNQSPKTMPLYVKLKNPFVFDANGRSFRYLDTIENAKEIKKHRDKLDTFGWTSDYQINIDDVAIWAKEQGFDGAIAKNIEDNRSNDRFNGDTIIVFSPNQIKSIHNKGTFDESSAVITDSVMLDGDAVDFDAINGRQLYVKIRDFVQKSLSGKSKNESLSLGIVTTEEASRIKEFTGLSFSGYEHIIDSNHVRHIHRKHPSDVGKIANLPDIFRNFDYAKKSLIRDQRSGGNTIGIELFKCYEDGLIVCVEIRDQRDKKLEVKTLYKANKELIDHKLPANLRLCADADTKSIPPTLTPEADSDGIYNAIIPKNTNQVNMDGAETMNIQELPHETVQMDMAFISTMLTNKELKEKETELKEKYKKANSAIGRARIIKELSDLSVIEEGAFSDVATKTAMKEINDSEISFNKIPKNAKNLTVGDIMDAPLLFSKYPQLRNIKINHLKSSSLYNGQYRPSENALYVSPPDYSDEEREKEINERFYSADAKYVKNVFGDYGTLNIVLFLKEESELSESALAKKRAYVNFSRDLNKQKEKEKNRLPRTYERQKSVILHELQHAIQEIENWGKGGIPKNKSTKAYEEYRRLWGEQQARAVQHRMDMAKEEKQKESWQDTLKRVEKKYDNPIVKLNHGNSAVITDSVMFDMSPHRHHIAEKMIGIPQEIEKFGRNFTKFKGKPREAIEHLIKIKNGQVRGAIHKEGVGDIDFIWGKVTDAKRHKGYGLAHIIDKHGVEEAMKLPKMIEKLNIKIKTNNGLILEDEEYRVSIRLDWIGKSKIWVLTAFDKREADANKAVSDAVEPTHLMPTHTCHKTGATSLSQIIPKNTNQVNMDGAEPMNILQQIKTERSAIAKAKLNKQWRSLSALQRTKALKEYRASTNAVNNDALDALETIKAVLENANATSPLQNTQRVL